ncbi:MAG: hypothetical protein Q4G09_03830 [Clostridia bacterium]|nr:hypothetical protein [Clostridia bacterium]
MFNYYLKFKCFIFLYDINPIILNNNTAKIIHIEVPVFGNVPLAIVGSVVLLFADGVVEFFVTVTSHVTINCIFSILAVIVAVPSDTAVTIAFSTLTISSLLLDHLTKEGSISILIES